MGLLKKYLDFFGEDFDFFNWIVMFSFIVLMFSVQVVSSEQVNQTGKIVGSDITLNDSFGSSTFLSGDYLFVGSPKDNSLEYLSGAVYIFKKNASDQFEQIQKIQGDDLEPGDTFGNSLSSYGDYLIIGNEADDSQGSNTGAVYIFKKNASDQFEQTQKIMASDATLESYFGKSISLYGDYALIGAYEAAYIFKKNASDQFEQTQRLSSGDSNSFEEFGNSVSLYGDYALIGDWKHDPDDFGNFFGAAYIFKKNASDQFEQTQKIMASDASSNSYFGNSVSLSGEYAIIGAYEATVGIGDRPGAAYIFKKNASDQFEQTQKLIPDNPDLDSQFASSVYLEGDYAVVGSPYEEDSDTLYLGPAVYFYKKNSSNLFEQSNKTFPSDYQVDDLYGTSLTISGEFYVVGAKNKSLDSYAAGAAYSYIFDIAPLIIFDSPSNNSNSTDNNLNITYNIIDRNSDSCWYSLDFGLTNNSLSGCENITSVVWENQTYNLTLWANDTAGNFNSSILVFNMGVEDPVIVEETPSSGGGGGGGGGSTTSLPNDLEISISKFIEMGLNDKVFIPVNILNKGSSNMRGITLSVSSSNSSLNPILQESFFESLSSKQNKTLNLTLNSNFSLEGEYELYLNASVSFPNIKKEEIIYVRISEDLDLGRVTERISLAQDLFRENSQCLELNDLLIQAQRLIDEGKLEEARVIVQDAITKCRGLVTSQEETPFKTGLGFDLRIILFVVSGLIILSLIVALVLRKPHFNLKKAKRKKWKGFEF